MSTDFVRDNSSMNGISELLKAKLQGWNPTLIYSFMPGYKATVSWDLKLHVTCRGPRTVSTTSVPFDPTQPADPDLNKKKVTGFFVTKNVSTTGRATYLIPNINTVGDYFKHLAEEGVAANEPYTGDVFLSAADFASYKVVPGGSHTTFVCSSGWEKFSEKPFSTELAFASNEVQTVKFVDSGNGNYKILPNNLLSAGLRTYEEEKGQLVTSCLRVDGSKCYSESMGGIHAVGYMDLQGAGPDSNGDVNTGDAVIANGFVQVGDVTDQDTLMQVNIADSGPQYVEQYQSPDPVFQTGEYNFTDAATFIEALGGNEITIDPAILADLEGLRIQFNVEYTGRTFGEQVFDYTYTIGSQYTEVPLIQVYYRVELPAVDAPEQDVSVSGRVELRAETPIVLTAD